jgi:hypothetical protein
MKEIKITEWARQSVGYAIGALGEAVSSRTDDKYSFLHNIQKAQRNISEVFGEIFPLPELTEDEANLSSALHTYMRKNMDGKLSVVLYRLISENRGLNTWYSFIKGVNGMKNKLFRIGLERAEYTAQEIGTTDELFMSAALYLWFEHEKGQEDLDYVVKEWVGK